MKWVRKPLIIFQAVASVFKSTTLEDVLSPVKTRAANKPVSPSPGKGGNKSKCLLELFNLLVDKSTPDFVQHKLLEVFILLDNKVCFKRFVFPLNN